MVITKHRRFDAVETVTDCAPDGTRRHYCGRVIRICVDSNALHGDPLLRKSIAERLLDHARQGRCTVHLSPVVVGELTRQVNDSIKSDTDELRSRIGAMSKRHDVPADSLLEPLSPFAERLARDAANRMAELPLLAGVEVEPWPDVATHEVVGRELARRRPFMDIEKKGTIGHRDTIIWLGVVAVASANRDDPVCLVTNDGGFLKDRDLHADLIDDLRDAGLKPERVAVYRDLFGVLTMLDKVKAAQEARDAHEAREAQAAQEANEAKEAREAQERAARVRIAVRQALHEYNGELVSLQWGREFDERDGGYSDPEIDAGLPSALEDVRVSFVESTFDILLDPPAPKSGMPATCEYDVEIGFDGVMDKYEWFSESYGDVELWGSDLDDHYVQVHAERTVRITVQVIYDDETDTAEVVQLVGGTWTG